MRLASFSSVSRFRYPLKSSPKPLHAYSAIRYFPLRSRSMVRINTEVCSRITLKSSKVLPSNLTKVGGYTLHLQSGK